MQNRSAYKVDGEAGRFEFTTHHAIKDGETAYNSARDLFSELGNNEFYKTVGFKETAMTYGDTDKSFRKTTFLLNRIRHQENGGTSWRTLRENTVKEGGAVLEHMSEISARTFCEAEFSENGTWHGSEYAGIGPATLPVGTLAKAVEKHGDVTIDDVLNNLVCFEDPALSVNIAIDDVIVKKQKETREDTGGEEERKRKYVHNTIARVENGGRSYTLNGNNTFQTLLFITALILRSGLLGLRFQFFTDGHTVLNQSILKQFCWYGNMGIILDWYHLGKKCKEKLSLAMKGRVLRNETLRIIMPLLWYG
ncbi:MAG: hypothetical protein GY755_22360, partial [Chloroflexi bacterium]|nr:hypothetical protein [Chloroflexota bacterium]